MGEFFVYSLKASICLTAFYLVYKLLLSRETFHRFNRVALLSMMFLSVAIPLIKITILPVHSSEIVKNITMDGLIVNNMEYSVETNISSSNILSIILLIYLIGCCFFLLRSFWGFISILQLIRNGEQTFIDNNIRLTIHKNNKIVPFSLMKNIAVSEPDMDEAGEIILLHEQAHIRQYHTYDLLLVELCILFQWYNPAAWLLYRELKNIHEFEADMSVIEQGIDIKQYQLLLIKKTVGNRLYSIANSLNHSNLKRRITMMLHKKSKSWARLKYVIVLPLAAVFVIAFARTEISQTFDEISSAKVSNLTLKDKYAEVENISAEEFSGSNNQLFAPPDRTASSDTTVFAIVDEMPEYPGGQQALMEFISNNVKYPENAQKNGISGKIFVQFVIETDGSIGDVKIGRGVDPELDAEGIRVVESMPKWKPGKERGKFVRVSYTVPINFSLKNSSSPETQDGLNEEETSLILIRSEHILVPLDENVSSETIVHYDEMPEFPGGNQKLVEFISQNVEYPSSAHKSGIQGIVFVSFVIETDGSIEDVIIAKGVSPELDEEALRVIKLMPKWKPGKKDGKNVRLNYTIPIHFLLQDTVLEKKELNW